MSKTVRSVLLVALAAVLLLAIGMLTRMPAMRLGVNYGLHAVLAAFFYGAVAAGFEAKTCHAYPVVAGAVVVGALLGRMSPVMAVAEVLPALAYLVVFLVTRGRVLEGAKGEAAVEKGDRAEFPAVLGGTAFAAFAYVGTIVGGMLFSGYAPAPADIAFLMLAGGLGLLGSLAGLSVAKKVG